MLTNSKKFAAMLFAFGLTAAACGSSADELTDAAGDAAEQVVDVVDGDDDAAMEDEADDEAAMEDGADDEAAMEDESDDEASTASDVPDTVIDIAVSADEFSILIEALDEAGLLDTLEDDGPFTVFAPTDEAFETLFENGNITDEQFFAVEDLRDVLTYHVISGNVLAEDAIELAGESAETVSGNSIDIDVIDNMVVLNGNSLVVTADLVAGNGVVHIVDSVLLASDAER